MLEVIANGVYDDGHAPERSAGDPFLSKPSARILDGMVKPARPLDRLRELFRLHLGDVSATGWAPERCRG